MTLEQLLESYIAASVLREPTKKKYRAVVKRALPFVGVTPVASQSSEQYQKLRGDILARSKPVTWNGHRRHLAALFNFAIQQRMIQHSPLAAARPAPVGTSPKKTVSVDLVRNCDRVLAQGVKSRQPVWFWRIAIRLLYGTGIRRAQFMGLSWGDFDESTYTLKLSSTTSKTHREWTVPVPEPLVRDLQMLRSQTAQALGRSPHAEEPMFSLTVYATGKVERLSEHSVSAFFRRFSRLAGVRVSPHRFRHTVATELVGRGDGNLKRAQYLLGHTTIATTLAYVAPKIEDLRKEVNQLSGL